MLTSWRALALTGALVLLAGAGTAEERPLSLAQALALAEAQNPELQAARERASARAEQAELGARGLWPRVALSSGWSRANAPASVFMAKLNAGEFAQPDFEIGRLNDPGWISHLTTTLGVELPLDPFGRVAAGTRSARALASSARAGLDEALAELRLRTIEAYRGAALARRAAELTERAQAGARSREADLRARVDEGAALQAELLRARTRRRQREAELAERRGEAAAATAVLARLLGLPAGEHPTPLELALGPGPFEGDEMTWVSQALAQRALRTAAGQGVEAARWALQAEKRTRLPELLAWGQLQDDRNRPGGGKRSAAVGALLRLAAFDGTRAKREAAAAAALRAAEQDARAASDQIRLEVELAFRRAQSARERHAAAEGGAEDGREALRVMQERRQAGLATLTDELETEAAALGAELEEVRAATDAALADAALRRAAGGL